MPRTTHAEKNAAADGFAGRLRDLRRQRRVSQTELGRLAGLHYTHLSRYERGLSRPAGDSLKRLADALGVSTDYLLEGSPDQAARGRFEDLELLRQFQDVEKLPDEDKLVVMKLLEAFLTKRQLQELAAR